MYINNKLQLVWEDAVATENALKKCGICEMSEAEESNEFLKYFVDWYFSGNGWMHKESEEPQREDNDYDDYLYTLEKEEKLCKKLEH